MDKERQKAKRIKVLASSAPEMKVASTSPNLSTRRRRTFPLQLAGSSSDSAPLYRTAMTRRMKKMTSSSCHHPFRTSSRAASDQAVNQARVRPRCHRKSLMTSSMTSKPTGPKNTNRARMATLSVSLAAKASSSLLAAITRRMPSIASNKCLRTSRRLMARTSTPQLSHLTTKNH